MLVYLSYLCRGNTLKGMVCREQTIRGYMKVAVDHVFAKTKRDVRVYPEEDVDPSKWKEHPHFEAMLKRVRRWQGIKNRQEGLTKTMVAALRRKHSGDAWDSHNQSLVDWLVIGLHTGYRRCEWAQEKEVSGKRSDEFQIIEELPDRPIYAVLPTDIVFVDHRKRAISDPFDVPRAQIAAVKITWRFQKNGDHGQTVTFSENTADRDFCIVSAFLNVFRRFSALGVDPAFPLAVYRKCPGSQRASWFTVRGITKTLKAIAAEVYSDEADVAAMKFTPHSIRIGACMILFAANHDAAHIKHRLRWKSDSFMSYLRDVPQLALNQVRAVNDADVDSFMSSLAAPSA
jgi:uncharacterized cupredoxin-like copper-binding protein